MPLPSGGVHKSSGQRSVPVVIEARSDSDSGGDWSRNRAVEVCGSWQSDQDYISCDEQEGRLRESIADAMKEMPQIRSGPMSVANGEWKAVGGYTDCAV